jgi:gas vesicle protein
MGYLFSFLGGLAAGAAAVLLLRKKSSGETPSPGAIKKIVERSIEAYKQNKKTEEIIAEIDDLMRK